MYDVQCKSYIMYDVHCTSMYIYINQGSFKDVYLSSDLLRFTFLQNTSFDWFNTNQRHIIIFVKSNCLNSTYHYTYYHTFIHIHSQYTFATIFI